MWFRSKKKRGIEEKQPEELFSFFIPKESTIYGDIETSLPCRIEGLIEGDVQVKGKVIVSEEAEVKGSIRCDDVIVYGKVWRNITCSNKAQICTNGYVEGKIDSKLLEVEEGATVRSNMVEEKKPEFVYDTVVGSILAPVKVTVSERTWF